MTETRKSFGSSVFHCVKSVCSRNCPYFPAFRFNTETYFVSLCIQSESGKIQSRITPNTDTFYVVFVNQSLRRYYNFLWSKFKKLWLSKYLTGEKLFNYDVGKSKNSIDALIRLGKYQIGSY